jgi:hypothetical protein
VTGTDLYPKRSVLNSNTLTSRSQSVLRVSTDSQEIRGYVNALATLEFEGLLKVIAELH